MKELAQGIELFSGVFLESKKYVYDLSEDIWDNEQSKMEYGRKADTVIISNHIVPDLYDEFNKNIEPSIHEYVVKYKTVYVEKESATLLRYGSGEGFSNHTDDHPKLQRRRISLVYYVNDDYSGGNIEFPRFGINLKPSAGDLLIFPSSYVYNHIVHPVQDGTRYSIAQFLC